MEIGVSPGRGTEYGRCDPEKVESGVNDISVRMYWRLFDRIALAFVGVLWTWKAAEYAGRAVGLLERNLGWGFYINLTIPVMATILFLLFMSLRRLVWLLIR